LMLDAAMSSRSINSVADHAEPKMPEWSRYSGQPVDVSRRRLIFIRELSEDSSAVNVDHLTVDYFLHESTFRTAVIPLIGVSDVYGQSFNFSAARIRRTPDGSEVVRNRQGLPKRKIPILNHVQSRFQFQTGTGIRLYPLFDEMLSDPVAVVDDFVYSLEVTGPPGVKFNMKDGLRGNLLSAHRMLSTREMVFERLVVENQTLTESPPLPLNETEKRSLLLESLCRSHRAGMTEPYYLYRVCGTNNCTSSPLQILDRVVQYNLLQRIGSMLYRLPLSPRFYLRVRGLDASPGQRNLVRAEFAAYIDHPETRARKRVYLKRLNAARKAQRRAMDSAGESRQEP
jgi:hypothetical protein